MVVWGVVAVWDVAMWDVWQCGCVAVWSDVSVRDVWRCGVCGSGGCVAV